MDQLKDVAEKAMNKLMDEAFPKSEFYDLPINEKKCNNPEHDPPSHLHIPQGKGYKHVCPGCGKITNLVPPQISL